MSYLIDTNIISELIKKTPKKSVINWMKKVPDSKLYISVITLGEIRKGVECLVESKKKDSLRFWLECELVDWFQERVLLVDHAVVDRWSRLQATATRSLPAIDSLIAATALHHDLTLVTRNTKDFDGIDLSLINPF